jgi:lipopolysaccharide/colanic/teichoic acid biosynthesis glycosyltransferase
MKMSANLSSPTTRVLKRLYDLAFSAVGLAVLSPLLILVGIAVKCSDGGPVIFRQRRIGQCGRPFYILKFRTMFVNAEHAGLSVTRLGDSRVTPVGRFLRKAKLDELPQLWNVLRGEMSLVGPRPEVPRYVERYTPVQRRVLELKPGITDLATLEFRNEEELLSSAGDVEQFYLTYCVPRKIELNLRYAREANLWRDSQIIFQTLLPRKFNLKPGRFGA